MTSIYILVWNALSISSVYVFASLLIFVSRLDASVILSWLNDLWTVLNYTQIHIQCIFLHEILSLQMYLRIRI